jgi:2-polyprenyl-3-methyl-5-hydroxy-6-metoxy-1,4-benzoquinol methylase
MLKREDVISAYIDLLGRPPESDVAIAGHQQAHSEVASLIAAIRESQEFKQKHLVSQASTPQITRAEVISAYKAILHRPPESEDTIRRNMLAHSDVASLEAALKCSEEHQQIQTFSSKRKIKFDQIEAEVAAIARLAREDPAGATYAKALNDFWLEIPSPGFAPHSEEYRQWVMYTYTAISNRSGYHTSSEETDYDLETYVKRPVPYLGGNAQAIGDMLMAIGHVIRAMDLHPESKVLELGFGWGNTTVQLAMAGYQVTGIDIAPNFVEMVRRRLVGLDLTADLKAGSFFDVEAIDQQFDAVLFFECFHHCDDHVRLLKALPNILKPGGKLVLAGETINNALPYPWGINPDSQAIYCIREFGWLELSFREDYLLGLLEELGWYIEKHNFLNAMGVTYVATRKDA